MRVFTACLATETNSFSPIPTGLRSFAACHLVRGGVPDDAQLFAAPLAVFRRLARARGDELFEGLSAFAEPAGPTVRAAYEALRDELLADLARAMPVDMVLLSLHGAMIADGYDDCEGDLLARVRAIVGPAAAIGAELDPHCHLSDAMVAHATALVCFKHYPHVDFCERAEELYALVADAAAGRTRPRMAAFDCRMIGGYHTTAEPMKGYVERLCAREREPGVLSLSVAHSFPWGDVPDAGTKLLAITDDDPALAARLAAELGRELRTLRGRTFRPQLGLEEGLDRALACPAGLVVIGDVSDNTGGGAPGDATFILAELMRRGVEGAALACFYDPVAVAIALEAGEGATLDLRVGGKLGPMSGQPVDLRATVRRVARDLTQPWGRSSNRLGDVALIEAAGLELVLNDVRTQVFSPEVFRALGVEPERRRLIVVKSSQHYRACFAPIAAEVLDVAAPGAIRPDLAALPLRRIRRPKWPFDPDAFADEPA
jgi:microcystin degradation protein MlrC